MTRKESLQIGQRMLDDYRGILFHNQEFAEGSNGEICYEFDCPEFEELGNRYNLAEIAGKGSDFARAKGLLHYLAPRLTHSSWYDNHVPCNALDLLEYSLNKPEQGINCLNKAKILAECCLAVGIYARRVSLMPYSPYDFDNHVVTEIYDRTLEKWIMLDPSTDGYFIDEEKTPLSILEMRHKFANGEFVTFTPAADGLKDIQKLAQKHLDKNLYICKNLFWFTTEAYSTFGQKGAYLLFAPKGYEITASKRANLTYRLANMPQGYEEIREKFREALADLQEAPEPEKTAIAVMEKAPTNSTKG